MKVEYKGLTVQLPDDDERAAKVVSLLFPSLAPPEPEPEAVPLPAPEPVAVPRTFAAFWEDLSPVQRLELNVLAKGDVLRDDLQRTLGISQSQVQGQHVSMSNLARRHGLSFFVTMKGRDRRRCYCMPDDVAVWVRALVAEDQAIAAFADARVRRSG